MDVPSWPPQINMQTTSVSLLDRLGNSATDRDWQRLLEIYRPFIRSVTRAYPMLASQADDVTQEVMLVLMRELPTFQRQRQGSFRAWLRNITVNQLRIAIRKSKKFPQNSSEAKDLDFQLSQLDDPSSELARQWDEQHDKFVLAQVMASVKGDFQSATWEAFQMYAVRGEPASEVAKKLGLSLNSVLLAKSRVIKRMRAEAAGLVDA